MNCLRLVALAGLAWMAALLGCAPARPVTRNAQGRAAPAVSRAVLTNAPRPPAVPPWETLPLDLHLDAFCGANGELADNPLVLALLHRPGELEAFAAPAQRGDRRVEQCMFALESTFHWSGRGVAEKALRPECLVAQVLPKCRPDWSGLDFLRGRGPVASRLLRVTHDAYLERVRELAPQVALTQAAMNMLLVEGALSTTLAVEGQTALVEARLKVALAGLSAEGESGALAAKLGEAEALESGPRMSADPQLLELDRPVLDNPPKEIAGNEPLWAQYVRYWEERFAKLKAQQKTPGSEEVKPPLRWEAYHPFRNRFAEAVAYQRRMAQLLRDDAARPRNQRAILKDFEKPIVLENVGVSKGKKMPTRYADILVFEGAPGQPLRVHSFSVKQRELGSMTDASLQALFKMDETEATGFYGGTLEIRRESTPWFEKRVQVEKVYLLYDARKPPPEEILENALKKKWKVEVLFR